MRCLKLSPVGSITAVCTAGIAGIAGSGVATQIQTGRLQSGSVIGALVIAPSADAGTSLAAS